MRSLTVSTFQTYKLFDLICGTSTGAILAFAVGIKRYSLLECEAMYKGIYLIVIGFFFCFCTSFLMLLTFNMAGLCQDVFTIGASPLTAASSSSHSGTGLVPSPLLPAQPPNLISQSASSSTGSALLSDTTPSIISLSIPSGPLLVTNPSSNSVTVRVGTTLISQ